VKRPVQTLALLLGAQLLLAGGLALAAARGRSSGSAPLLTFDREAIDRLVVEGTEGARAELVKADGAWKVASRGGFPAEAGKVQRVLERLAALKRSEPVATSAEAAARFKVADGGFERRITLEAKGKPVGTVLLGTAAAMRSVHARVGGASDVQLVELSTWDLPAAPDEWIDRGILRVSRAEIEAVVAGKVTLERDTHAASSPGASDGTPPSGWRATGLPKGASLDQVAADALVSAVADLSITGIADAEPASASEALVFTLRRTGGSQVEYRLKKPAAGGDWTLRVSGRSEVFRVAPYTAESLQRVTDPGTLSVFPARMRSERPEDRGDWPRRGDRSLDVQE
jgi:hypothetical protein